MKLYKISLALLLGFATLNSCSDKLDLSDPNRQTSGNFGNTVDDLEETVIAAYNHIRMEGTYARVGYGLEVTRGDDVWNSSQVWYLEYDDFNAPVTGGDNAPGYWPWRESYYTINVCNFILSRTTGDNASLSDRMKRIKGQALFLRALSYYNLATYYQNPPLITDYAQYSSMDGLYASNVSEGDTDGNAQYDRVLDQVEKDFAEAIDLLPAKTAGGEWAKGRATSGAAAGFYARALMQRHKYAEALTVLKNILSTADGGNQMYGEYKLMANYGDNFREGSAYENNAESLFEVQFLDYGSQGTDDEWTPVNTSPNATQGHAVESNFCPDACGGWADLSATPWLYWLYKSETTTDNSLDHRLYWTIGTYEPQWDNNPLTLGNVCYTKPMTEDATTANYFFTNPLYGGLPIAKHTNLRTGLYEKVVSGLHCGVNIRLMRYSDVLLRAAECENEVNGPTANAFKWIDRVRSRAKLANLDQNRYNTKDKLFEQIANVERPKEFGCEAGRFLDLLRWGFLYSTERLQQLKEHGAVKFWNQENYKKGLYNYTPQTRVDYNSCDKTSFNTYIQGHEFMPILQFMMNDNPQLVGNSANNSTNNASYFFGKGWTIHPVVNL